ncbi:MAG: CorA family divalent cation transporter [Flavobacteriales bacterium]|jgi:magnesium transporter
MKTNFLKQTTLIKYSRNKLERKNLLDVSEINLIEKDDSVKWLNTYGIDYQTEFNKIIQNNKFDDFIIKLLKEKVHPNKVIELDNILFIALQVLKIEKSKFNSEQMIFIVSKEFIWSIQEKNGDYFEWIRQRLDNGNELVRKKKTHYLLYLILESIIDNYQSTYQKSAELINSKIKSSKIQPTPEFTALVENRKQELFNFKKASNSLRDTIVKLEKVELVEKKTKYFTELKEQSVNLNNDIDFELNVLESKLNLIFSIQGHRLNQVMKTLTIFSVIFIPLTFLSGVYGMNFKYMPGLNFKNGYYVLIGIMLLITIISIWYFFKKKWF